LCGIARPTAERLRRRARLLVARPFPASAEQGGGERAGAERPEPAAMRTLRVASGLVLQVGWRDGADAAIVAALLRRGAAAAFDAQDRATLAALRAHVVRAMRLAAELDAVERRAHRRHAAFDALPQPLVVADGRAGVAAANRAARSLPRAAGVGLRRGPRLAAAAAADAAALGRALALTTDPLLRLPAATLALGPGGRTEAQLLALTAGDVTAAGRPGRRLALVALRLARPPVPAPAAIPAATRARGRAPAPVEAEGAAQAARRALRLTAAEDRLLRLVLAGCDAAGAARRLGVALATVRTQLRSLYDKTGCRGRAALIARFAGTAGA
jgi:DNA-binding CsgD family transcriptional regulator